MKTILIIFYNILWTFIYVLTLPYTYVKRKTAPAEWRERMGIYPFDYSNRKGCIWIHGASLGEITAASKLALQIKKKFPSNRIIVSAMTVTGKEHAAEIMEGIDEFVLLPFDYLPIMNRGIERINPRTLILIETEIWPSLVFICRKKKVKIVLANARLSDATYKRYLRFKCFSKRLFNQIDTFFPKSDNEKEKFLRLGVHQKKIGVVGSLKMENSITRPFTRNELGIPPQKTVIVAGSVRKGEEEMVIRAFKVLRENANDSYLIIAPRHMNRVGEIESILAREGLSFLKRTEKVSYNGEHVLILDTIGELRSIYSVADIAFVGGTLLPYGGHNLLEPAFFGVPTVFGPHTNNARTDALDLIETKSALLVKNEKELQKTLLNLLKNTEMRKEMGKNSRNYIEQKRGVVDAYIAILKKNGFIEE